MYNCHVVYKWNNTCMYEWFEWQLHRKKKKLSISTWLISHQTWTNLMNPPLTLALSLTVDPGWLGRGGAPQARTAGGATIRSQADDRRVVRQATRPRQGQGRHQTWPGQPDIRVLSNMCRTWSVKFAYLLLYDWGAVIRCNNMSFCSKSLLRVNVILIFNMQSLVEPHSTFTQISACIL